MKPVYIVGCPRSGTTLLRLILTSHSKLCIPHEYRLFEVVSSYYTHGTNKLDADSIDRLLKELYSHQHFLDWEIQQDDLEQKLTLSTKTLPSVIDCVYQCYTTNAGKSGATWGDKFINSTLYLDKIQNAFPDAKFVHIIRDGRDVFASIKKWGSHYLDRFYNTEDHLEVSHLWNKCNTLILDFKRSYPNSVRTIRYEDLITQPEKTAQKICCFLGLEYEDAMLRYHENTVEKGHIPKERREAFHENTTKPILKKNAGKYLQHLTPKQVEIFNRNSFCFLEEFHYLNDDDKIASESLLYRAKLQTFVSCKLKLLRLKMKALWKKVLR